MWYRQLKVADTDCMATKPSLKVNGKWIDGILLDKDGNNLPLPCKVKAGEIYMVEVKE